MVVYDLYHYWKFLEDYSHPKHYTDDHDYEREPSEEMEEVAYLRDR